MIVYEKNSSMILPRVDDDLMETDDGGGDDGDEKLTFTQNAKISVHCKNQAIVLLELRFGACWKW